MAHMPVDGGGAELRPCSLATPTARCYFRADVKGGKFEAPIGDEVDCIPPEVHDDIATSIGLK